MRMIVKGVVWMMLIFPSLILAQEPDDFPPDLSKEISKEKREKIKTFKIGYLTEKLSLTTEEATRFWPVYNDFQKKKYALRKQVLGSKKQRKNIDSLSDAELEKIVDNQMKLKEKMLALEKEFYVKIKEILPIKKIYLLGKAERDFKRIMIQKMQKRRRGKKGR
ncbi:MAG: hypothetical protein ACJA0Q_001032 [Saprospiraceae bacterium]|jgi:hypothetical protein